MPANHPLIAACRDFPVIVLYLVFTYVNYKNTYVNLIEIGICEVNTPEPELTARLLSTYKNSSSIYVDRIDQERQLR